MHSERPMTSERHLVLLEKELPPSAEWPPRGNGWQGIRVVAGQGYWLQSGAPARPLAAGDGVFTPGNVNGLLRASQLGPLQLQYFTVLPQLLTGVLTLTESQQFAEARQNPESQAIVFLASDHWGQKFARLMVTPATDHLTCRCACLQLWSEVYGSLLTDPLPGAAADDKLRARFRQLVGQIPQAELADHTLAELAAQLHCSERHFSRLFRDEFGDSLRARQIELRLQRARQLLVNSNAKIINVAYESGYRHLGLFNAMFKKRFGMTPSEWRRENLPKSLHPRPQSARHAVNRLLAGVAMVAGLALLLTGSFRPGTWGASGIWA